MLLPHGHPQLLDYIAICNFEAATDTNTHCEAHSKRDLFAKFLLEAYFTYKRYRCNDSGLYSVEMPPRVLKQSLLDAALQVCRTAGN